MLERTDTRTAPLVSIIIPVFNDQGDVSAALDSCSMQTLSEIEIIVVDDASTDGTAAIVQEYADGDPRVRLISLEINQTAFQARRIGILAATAPYVLFLDGDDELLPDCASMALSLAREKDADVVAFGVEVVRADGATGSRHEVSMQPKHDELLGDAIASTLFPVGTTAQGQLWRYLFDRDLLVAAYGMLPESLRLARVNDLPIAFLALTQARKYVSTRQRLYRYFFQRGASGHRVGDIDGFLFNASAIDSIESIAHSVAEEASRRDDSTTLRDVYGSVRLSVIGRVLDYVCGISSDQLREECLSLLTQRVGLLDLIYACNDFCAKALPLLATSVKVPSLEDREPRAILLRTGNLGTGGVQGVVVAQAAAFSRAGFEVTIAIDAGLDTPFRLPDGVELIQIEGATRREKLRNYVQICASRNIDVVIDHHILYNERWPLFALAAAGLGVPTIGWLHNFALRPILDGNTRSSFLRFFLPTLAMTVVLSRSDVAYWKLLGVPNVAYLPNPPSPFLGALPSPLPRRLAPDGRIEIVWWGRLQQSTKQVGELVDIGVHLRALDVDFRITIIGPDSKDLTAATLLAAARACGLEEHFAAPGPMSHDELLAATSEAHVFVSTSVIEGYPLALVEAQALALPLVMYELPWLATLDGNAGIISVAQGDQRGAARAIAKLATDSAYFARLSEGSLAAARSALSHDFERLYTDLVRGDLAPLYSPEPRVADSELLLQHFLTFTERLISRERRALDRAHAKVLELEREFEKSNKGSIGGAKTRRLRNKKNPPSIPRTGLRGWLMGFLPTTMKQSSYYARHQYNVSVSQSEQVLAEQHVIAERLARIEAMLQSSKSEPGR